MEVNESDSVVVGLSGYAGSGKTTVGRMMAERTGGQVVHFADPIKKMVLAIDPLSSDGVLASAAINAWGETEAKLRHDTYRHTLRTVGESVRALEPSFWINQLAPKLVGVPLTFVPDVRTQHEAAFCSIVLSVTRPGIIPDDHPTETDGRHWCAAEIVNDGDLSDLERKVDQVLEVMGWEGRIVY